MNNATMIDADRNTHVKIVAVSLAAATLVIALGIGASRASFDTGIANESPRVFSQGNTAMPMHR